MIFSFGGIGFIIGYAIEAGRCWGDPNIIAMLFAGWACDPNVPFGGIGLFLGAILGYIIEKLMRKYLTSPIDQVSPAGLAEELSSDHGETAKE